MWWEVLENNHWVVVAKSMSCSQEEADIGVMYVKHATDMDTEVWSLSLMTHVFVICTKTRMQFMDGTMLRDSLGDLSHGLHALTV